MSNGFGYGPFGRGPFGRSDWSREVLMGYLPEDMRIADTNAEGALERFLNTLRPLFDKARLRIEDFLEMRDPLRARSYDTQTRMVRLGRVLQKLGNVEQHGIDGIVLTAGSFQSATARFKDTDVGKQLEIRGSTLAANNTTYTIAAVFGVDTVVLTPATQLDPGPLRWTLRAVGADRVGVTTVQVIEGDLDEVTAAWMLDDGGLSARVLGRYRFRRQLGPRKLIDAESALAWVDPAGNLQVPDGVFTSDDTGKPIILGRQDEIPEKPQYAISRVVSMTELVLKPIEGGAPIALVPDEGPFDLLVLPFAELDLDTTIPPVGVALDHGVDAEVIGLNLVRLPSIDNLTFNISGASLQLAGSANGNDGVYAVASLLPDNVVSLVGPVALSGETDLVWYLRARSAVGDGAQVRLRTESMLKELAQEIGLDVDASESTERQRSWVANAAQWYDSKGLAKAYRAIGLVSGFNVQVSQLWAVDRVHALGIPSLDLYEAGLSGAGKRGIDGSVFVDVLGGFFEAPTAQFEDGDVGSFVRVSGAATGGNNQRYEIMARISATRVRVSNYTVVVSDDANNGTLSWYVARLYTTVAPRLPRMDDMNADLLQQIIETESAGALTFKMDSSCQETEYSTDVPLTVLAVQKVGYNRWRLTITSATVNPFPDAPEVVSDASSRWVLVAGATEYAIENRPQGGPPNYTVDVISVAQPALGAITLRYECPLVVRCGYCPASSVLVNVQMGSIAGETGTAIEKATERLIRRLDEARPLHVRLVVLLGTTLQATLSLSTYLVTGVITGATIHAPLSAHFDVIATDTYNLDQHLLMVRVLTP